MTNLATIAAFGFPDFNPATLLRIYRDLGCQACQFYRNVNRPLVPGEARQVVEDLGMPFDSIHGVFGPEYDPSSPDETNRQASIETYRVEGHLALELGGTMVVVHPAPVAVVQQDITPSSLASRVDPLRRSMEQLATIGEQLGVTYLIENLPGNYHFGSDPEQLAGIIRELNHPRLRMCFDTGHAHMTATNHAVAEVLGQCLDVVAYCHVSDNDTHSDAHLAPGEGTIAWDDVRLRFQELHASASVMLEVYQNESTLRALLANGLADRLKHLVSTP